MSESGELIDVCINMFGPIISEEQIGELLDHNNEETLIQHSRILLNSFFNENNWRSDEILKRYARVGSEEFYIPLVPHTNEININISRPLCSAKKFFCLGEYLAAIGLSGIVSEMLSMLIWHTNKDKISMSGGKINLAQEKLLFGKEMELQGQSRRVEIMFCLGFISAEMKQAFDRIREKRRKYLHFWDIKSKPDEEVNAETCLRDAFYLYKSVLNLRFDQGKVIYDDAILKYARKAKSP